jgi:threonine aldolase
MSAPAPAIDLRSDTVTKPSPEMRRAMFEAEVGDDVYAEDPTINRLEKRAAEIFGREAALFVPSGTMGNQIAIKLHTHHGRGTHLRRAQPYFRVRDGDDGALLGRGAANGPGHGRRSDMGAGQAEDQDQELPRCQDRPGFRGEHAQHGRRNYHPPEIFDEVCDNAHAAGLPVHLDGARVFNAAIALGMPVAQLTAKADTVMFCLSKGLGAPVGSLLVGSAEMMDRARIYRKALGGGMRQAGILAAAGLIALEQGPQKLVQDHANAKFLAEGLAQIPGIKIDPAKVQTNI